MILHGDGMSNLLNTDFFADTAQKHQLIGATVGMMNPPYSQGSKKNPKLYEISFCEHLLDSVAPDGRCVVIAPQSTFTGKTKDEQAFKDSIMKHHTLEGVITLNKDTFYGVGVMPCQQLKQLMNGYIVSIISMTKFQPVLILKKQ